MGKIIGIDVSKATFDVAFLHDNQKVQSCQFENLKKGFNQFIKHLGQDDHCVMEASGPYYLKLATFLFESGIKVSVENPLVIKRFIQMRMIRTKTDKKDAIMIAHYGFTEKPKLWKPKEVHIQRIRQISTVLEGLEKQRGQANNQLEAIVQLPLQDKGVVHVLKSLISQIEKKIDQLDQVMEDIANQYYQATLKALISIPGIGKKTAILLIAITNDFKDFESSKQLSAYIGLCPRIFQSGTSINGKGHLSKLGMSRMRKLLFMCSLSAPSKNKQCKDIEERLRLKGKPGKVVKVAVANKLLRQAFAIGKNLSTYDRDFSQNTCI